MAKRSSALHVINQNDVQQYTEQQQQKQHLPLKIKLDHLKSFDPLTENQRQFYEAYRRGDYFIALHGVAGTGKTFIALYKALEEILDKSNPFDKVIIVRSAVQGRDIGHLPGDIEGKLEIYKQPYVQICDTLFGRRDAYSRLEEQHAIEFISTSFIRGMTFDDAIIIVDEMQNCNFSELQTVITRVGHRSKIIFCGDYRQTDLARLKNDVSGIKKFLEIASAMPSHTRIEFTVNDIVRSSLVKDWIIAEAAYGDKEFDFLQKKGFDK